MFRHIFKYRLKELIRNKHMIFWSFLFPMFLGVLFHLAFGNLLSEEIFQEIPVGVVMEESEENKEFLAAAEATSLFLVREVTEEKAEAMLEGGQIYGYFQVGESAELIVMENGYEQTILKSFLDYYLQKAEQIKEAYQIKGQLTEQELQIFLSENTFLEEVKLSKAAPDNTVNYFYTLLAMAAMYASIAGVQEVITIQANQSPVACRNNLAPVPKMKQFLASVSATLLIQWLISIALFVFVRFVLKVDFGERYAFVILTSLLGTMTGVFFGTCVGAIVPAKESMKAGVVCAITMLGCYLAGMMNIEMKYIVQSNAPVLAFINPCTLLTDAYYSLYYYDTYQRYWMNMACLAALCILFIIITCAILRRRQYESI